MASATPKGKSKTPAAPSKAKKSPKTATKRATKGSKRSFPSMVTAAISTLATRGGSSYQAIEAYIAEKHPDVVAEVQKTYRVGASQKQALHGRVMRALHRLEADGQVDRHGHSYRLSTKAKRSPAQSRTKPHTRPMSAEGTKKAKKLPKDKDAPKRPLTSFMFYSKDQRATVKAENPNMSFGELGTAIAAQWAKATPAEKKRYEAMAAKDKERYATAMATYVPAPGSAAAEKAAKKAAKEAKPKRPPSEYGLFVASEGAKIRAAHPNIAPGEVFKRVGAAWALEKEKKAKAASKTKGAPPPVATVTASKKPAAVVVSKPAAAAPAKPAASKAGSKTAKK